MLGWPLGASAADQVVITTADAGAGSLRQAIADATAGDSITFAPGLDGKTITLTSGQLLLNKSLSIDASALTGGIAVSGNNASRHFNVPFGPTLELDGLILTGGNSALGGGSILNQGTLFISNCRLQGNTSTSSSGGALSNSGTAVIRDSVLSGNIASGFGNGGAISNSRSLVIERSTLSGNDGREGGGIYNNGSIANATLKNVTVSGNVSLAGAGGISNHFNASLTLIHTTISGNNTTVNPGGGIRMSSGTVAIENSIVAGNTANGGLPDFHKTGGTITATGKNLIGRNDSVTTEFPAGPLVGTSASPLDPLLAPLGDYGGPTQTMPPLPGSPAIDAASSGLANDQRGTARPQGANFDLGAVERIPDPLKVTGITRLGDGTIQIGFTKPSGMTHSVLASTNLDLPFNLWSNLGPALETPPGSGQFQFTDSQAPNYPRRFYVIEASDPSMVLVAGGTLVTDNELNGTAVSGLGELESRPSKSAAIR